MRFPFAIRHRKVSAPQRNFVRLEALENRTVPAIFTLGGIQSIGQLNNNGHIATADLDNDGKLDLVMTNYGSSKAPSGSDDPGNSITVSFGKGDGTFNGGVKYATGGSGSDFVSFCAIADLNADGFNDIVSVQTGTDASGSQSSYTVYLNSGLGTFPSALTKNVASGGANATWVGLADMNGDNVKDLAITHLGRSLSGTIADNNVAIFFGNKTSGKADGTFTLSNNYTTNFEFIPTAGTFLDVDNDADLDLVVTIPNAPPDDTTPQVDGKLGILTNSGGAFTIGTTYPISGGPLPISINTSDFNNDGKADLMVANAGDPDVNGFYLQFGLNSRAAILLGDGFGGFGAAKTQTTGIKSAFAVAPGDFNLDGNADMAVVSYGSPLGTKGAVVVYLGNGAGSFTVDSTYTDSSAGLQYLAVGDFDGKLNPDIVTSGDIDRIRVLSNSTRPTATTLVANPNPVVSGAPVVFTATTTVLGGYTDTPSGTVNFFDGGTKIGSGTLTLVGSDYQATFTTNSLSAGNHTITAKHVGQQITSPFTGASTSVPLVLVVQGSSNSNPSIGLIGNQTVTAGGATGDIAFTVNDAETPAGNLILSASSSDTSVVPIANISFGGSGNNRTVNVLSTAATGSSLITVTVTDGGGLTASRSFTLTVNAPPNTPPTITGVGDQTLTAGSTSAALAFTVGDAQTPATSLIVTATSSNTAVIPNSNLQLDGNDGNRSITIQSTSTTGSSTITLTVTDGGGLTATRTFTVTVTGPNTAPTITGVANIVLTPGAASMALPFTVGDAETPAANLTITFDSSNQAVIPASNILIGGSGANRTVTIQSTAFTGTSTITLQVTDGGGLTASKQFIVSVFSNTNPSITAIPNQSVVAGANTGPIAFLIGDNETPNGLTLSVTSSNPALIPVSAVTFGGTGSNRTVSVQTIAGFTDATTLTVTVTDANGGTASRLFIVTQTVPNTAPTISDIVNQNVVAGQTLGPISFTVGDAETPAANLVVTAVSGNTAIIPQANITLGGSGNTRTITITAPAGVSGTGSISVTVSDGSTSATDQFNITVTTVPNTPPTISNITDRTVAPGTTTGVIDFTVGDAETPVANLSVSAATSNGAVIPAGNLTLGGSGVNRTLIVAAPNGVVGTSTITVTVTDSNGASTSDTFVVTVAAPANTPPTITPIADRTLPINNITGAIGFTINDAETPAASLGVTATSSNTALLPASGIQFTGAGTGRFIALTPVSDQTGSTLITVTVSDGLSTATSTFTLTVKEPTPPGRAKEFAIGADIGGGTVTLYNPDASVRFSLQPFGAGFTGGVRVSAADFTGDDVADLVVGSGPGIGGRLLVIDGVTKATLLDFQPFGDTFRRGILVTAGDMTHDGRAELAVTAESGGGARVRVYSPSTSGVFNQLADFFALIGGDGKADENFRGGGRSGIGDFNGDGFGDLAFAAGTGGGPRVAIFDGKTITSGNHLKLAGDFFAFEAKLRNGCYIAVGDIDNDGFADLAAGAGPGGGPRVTIYDGQELMNNKLVKLKDTFVGDTNSRGGVRITLKDLDNDLNSDVLVGAGINSGSRAIGYSGQALLANPALPSPAFDFNAFNGFGGGVYVG